MHIDEQVASWADPIDQLHVVRIKDFPSTHMITSTSGQMLGYGRVAYIAFRRHGTIYSDAARTTPLVTWQADYPFTAANGFTVTNTDGVVLGTLSKTAAKTFRSARLQLKTPGVDAVGHDGAFVPAFAKQPSPVSFVYRLSGGVEVLRVERGWGAGDPLLVTCPSFKGERLDWRLAAAVAIVMDITLNRSPL